MNRSPPKHPIDIQREMNNKCSLPTYPKHKKLSMEYYEALLDGLKKLQPGDLYMVQFSVCMLRDSKIPTRVKAFVRRALRNAEEKVDRVNKDVKESVESKKRRAELEMREVRRTAPARGLSKKDVNRKLKKIRDSVQEFHDYIILKLSRKRVWNYRSFSLMKYRIQLLKHMPAPPLMTKSAAYKALNSKKLPTELINKIMKNAKVQPIKYNRNLENVDSSYYITSNTNKNRTGMWNTNRRSNSSSDNNLNWQIPFLFPQPPR